MALLMFRLRDCSTLASSDHANGDFVYREAGDGTIDGTREAVRATRTPRPGTSRSSGGTTLSDWHKSSYSSTSGQCVEAREGVHGADVRDTQNREAGHLSFSRTEWLAALAATLTK